MGEGVGLHARKMHVNTVIYVSAWIDILLMGLGTRKFHLSGSCPTVGNDYVCMFTSFDDLAAVGRYMAQARL